MLWIMLIARKLCVFYGCVKCPLDWICDCAISLLIILLMIRFVGVMFSVVHVNLSVIIASCQTLNQSVAV